MNLTEFEREMFFGKDKQDDTNCLSIEEIENLLTAIKDSVFVHLHTHSDYSLCKSTASVKALVGRACELGMTHLALTDHRNMFGAMEFIKTCKENRINPIIGCEVCVVPNKYHLVLLASNNEGYYNLMKLCSLSYLEGFDYHPCINEDHLVKYHKGFIALSGCLSGEIPTLIKQGNLKEAENKALQYKSIFGNDEKGNPNFYLEIQDHGMTIQKSINADIARISCNTGIPLVATNNVHYIKQEDADAHDALLCIGTGKLKDDERRTQYFGDQFYFKSSEEMSVLFNEYPEAVSNTVLIANRCKLDIPEIEPKDLPQYLPEFEIPTGFESSNAFLRHLAITGLENRYPKEKAENGSKWNVIQERAEYELSVIFKMNLTVYFLIVWEFVNFAIEDGIAVGPGRGAAPGSIIAYALNITNIDPLKYGLLFERFINPERFSMPDIDIDFEAERRHEVISFIISKYGRERAAQIITLSKFSARYAVKDVSRIMQIDLSEASMFADLITNCASEKLFEIERNRKMPDVFARLSKMVNLANKLYGVYRYSGIHAAGIVIGKENLSDIVPLYRDSRSGIIATQFDMNYLESAGLIKFDLLGLQTLEIIKHTEELICKRGGKHSNFSINNIPENDPLTFKLFRKGNTDNIFGFNSDGMKDILKEAKPDIFTDLIALYSLYRPGLMDYLPQFIDSKQGKQKINYLHPCLEDILKETYGIIIYQEQFMQIISRITGYSLGKAAILRLILSKNKADESLIMMLKNQYLIAALENGFVKDTTDEYKQISEIFDTLVQLSDLCFNKSHAVAYCKLAYQTGFLKANFPKKFEEVSLQINKNT